jgi:hypothetical protein
MSDTTPSTDRWPVGSRLAAGLLTAAIACLLAAAVPAAAQTDPADPANVKPVAGQGVATTTGVDASGHPYTATMTTDFHPDRIQPGDPLRWQGILEVVTDTSPSGWCNNGPSDPEPHGIDLAFFGVAPGTNLWKPQAGWRTTGHYAEGEQHYEGSGCTHVYKQTLTYETTGPAGPTSSLPPSCYQAVNTNSGLWFPGIETISGTIATLTVGDGDCGVLAHRLAISRIDKNRNTTDQGTVVSQPPGIDCGGNCTGLFEHGTSVTIRATAAPGWQFDHWEKACAGTQPTCTVAMDEDKQAIAVFTQKACYLTEAKFDAFVSHSGFNLILGTHDTSFTWCAINGEIDPNFPVASGMGDVASSPLLELLTQFGFSLQPDGDWSEARVIGGGSSATVKTFPRMKACFDFAALVTLVPWFKLYRFGTPAWKALPQPIKRKIVANAVGYYLEYSLSHTVAKFIARKALQKIPARIIKRLIKGVGNTFVWCYGEARARVEILLIANGHTVASVARDTGGPRLDFPADWKEHEPHTTTPLDLNQQFNTITRADGSMVAITEVGGPGVLNATALSAGGPASAISARRLPLAKGRKRVRSGGVVQLVLRPTKAGKRLLRRRGTAKVRVRLIFRSTTGGRATAAVKARFGLPAPRRPRP